MPSVNNIAVLVESMGKQDAEKVHQLPSYIVQTLNVAIGILGGRKYRWGFSVRQDSLYGRTVPQSAVGTSSGPSLAAALLDDLFEHPAGAFSSRRIRAHHRTSIVPD
jgi:hypothetical protein